MRICRHCLNMVMQNVVAGILAEMANDVGHKLVHLLRCASLHLKNMIPFSSNIVELIHVERSGRWLYNVDIDQFSFSSKLPCNSNSIIIRISIRVYYKHLRHPVISHTILNSHDGIVREQQRSSDVHLAVGCNSHMRKKISFQQLLQSIYIIC
uniref:Uncharacterized protein n=1 Tax=Ciona savignyi TaxID=51511 RepID=H2YUP1_CIOSA